MIPSEHVFPLQEDRMLEGVARQVVTDINHFFSKERLERAAMQDERLRLARELHDGVLQALTGATLQLEALSRLIDENPSAARTRLQIIEQLIAEEQQELRKWIQKLKPTSPSLMASEADLRTALETLCERVQRQWGILVKLKTPQRGMVSRTLGDDMYRLVQEGLSNIGRHAHAQAACVEVSILLDRVGIVITDDGSGFSFRGRYDLNALKINAVGPASLMDRVTSLHGELIVTSTPSGSHIEIKLPLDRFVAPTATTGSHTS
jgi:signal transduction histidine kinase